jgi:simple sugar transport system substrate-binding protein
MIKGEFIIFKGPLKDNKGNSAIAAGSAYEQTNVALESMNYLVDGVIGQIPG